MVSGKIKFAVAGTLDYLKEGVSVLKENGYVPELIIEGESRVLEFEDEIKNKKLKLLVCLAHPNILTRKELDLFEKGCINLHVGLPRYRGRHPVNWMLIDGLEEIPVSVHYMDEGIDTGSIITHDTILVERDDDYNSVVKKIIELGKRLIIYAIKQIESNSVYPRKQYKSQLRYTKRRMPEDSKIDWGKNSYEMHNFIRSLVNPMPNAFTYTEKGERVQFKRSYRGVRVGEVLAETVDKRYVISTQDGVILVKTDKKLKVGDRFVV